MHFHVGPKPIRQGINAQAVNMALTNGLRIALKSSIGRQFD
jgi:hypothetical protein